MDGSANSQDALRWAVRRAERTGATVRAVMSWHYPSIFMIPIIGQPVPPADAMEAATAEALAVQVETAVGDTSVVIEQLVRQGAPAVTLLDECGPDTMLVLGRQPTDNRLVRGSVSRRVAGAASCPVAIVPEGAEVHEDRPVVVGVDGSDNSIAALRWAASVADGPIRVVHVIDRSKHYGPADVDDDILERMGRALVEAAIEKVGVDPDRVTVVVEFDDARMTFIDPEIDASMIVIGSKGVTGIEGWLGSVATTVSTIAKVPIVLVPADAD
jgi:nucleotide-binding universal stress UspA family protein